MKLGGLSGAVADHLNQHHRALSRVWAIHARSAVIGHRVPGTATAVPLSSAAMQLHRRVAVDAPPVIVDVVRASRVSQSAADALRRGWMLTTLYLCVAQIIRH